MIPIAMDGLSNVKESQYRKNVKSSILTFSPLFLLSLGEGMRSPNAFQLLSSGNIKSIFLLVITRLVTSCNLYDR